jgi:hypothetical protein
MAVHEHDHLALSVLREISNHDVARSHSIAGVLVALSEQLIHDTPLEEIRKEIYDRLVRIRDDESLERGVRKQAGYHIEVLDALLPVLEREEVPA